MRKRGPIRDTLAMAILIMLVSSVALAGATIQPAAGDARRAGAGEPIIPQDPIVKLRFDQTLVLADRYQIDWLEVHDSRCPKGVTCVWEGEVWIRIAASKQGQFLGTYVLALRPGDPAAAIVTVDRQILRLVDVEPYPVVGKVPSRNEYLAELAAPRIDPMQ